MSTRLRVRDLATELDVSSKDLMTILRELKIPAKSHMSSLTDEEVEQVRNHHQNRAATPQVVDTRATSGVIVRKRHKAATKESPDASDEQAKDEIQTEAPAAPSSDVPATAPETHAKPRTRTGSRAVIVTPARIIEEAPVAHAAAEETVEEATPTASPVAEEAPASVEAAPGQTAPEVSVQAEDVTEEADEPSAETTSETEGESEEAKRSRSKKAKKTKPAPAPVQVKIISRPTIVEFPDTRVDGQPVRPMGPAARPMGPAGYTPRPSGPGAPRPSGPSGPGAPRPS